MPRVFISYSRRDEVFARQLATSLSDMGADIWMDIEDIPAGMKWSSAIQEGLDSADIMIVIISPDSMTSRNVEDEWQYYLDNRKPIVPVLLLPAKIHFQLSRIQYIDFHRQAYDSALRQLHGELRRKGVSLNMLTPDPAAAYRVPPHQYPTATSLPRPSKAARRNWVPLAVGGIAVLAVIGVVGIAVLVSALGSLQTVTPAPPTQEAALPTAGVPTDPVSTAVVPTQPVAATSVPVQIGLPGYPVVHNAEWLPTTRVLGGVEMVLAPVGCFTMGSTQAQVDAAYQRCEASLGEGACRRINLLDDEMPTTENVCFNNPFWIDRTEVTNAQYGSHGTFSGDDLPRTNITWFEAETFCQTRGARLPTEAEWEYAARGPDGLVYPWGNNYDGSRLNVCDADCEFDGWKDSSYSDGYKEPAPVWTFANGASWVGALNMSGNVWEWTRSIYRPYPYRADDGRENISDPSKRTLRGGSWNWIGAEARTTTRDDHATNNESSDWYGFRCVREWQPGDLG